jgi:muramidase (phage lysozyme)
VGKYEITRTTLRALVSQMGLQGTEIFTPELQDQFASRLLVGRGLNDYLNGDITAQEFQYNLAEEWGSIQNPYSTTTLSGQHLGTTTDQIQALILALSPTLPPGPE